MAAFFLDSNHVLNRPMYPKNNSPRKKKLTMEIFGIAITTTNKTGIITVLMSFYY